MQARRFSQRCLIQSASRISSPNGSGRFRVRSIQSVSAFSTCYKMHTKKGLIKIDSTKVPQYIGHATSRNMMKYNEDRYSLGFLNLPIQGRPQQVFTAAVFDGHGGDKCSTFLQNNLATYVESTDLEELSQSLPERYRSKFGGYWRSARILNSATLKLFERSVYDDMAVRLPLAYLAADFQELNEDELTGSTCTAAYFYTVDPEKQFWEPNTDTNLVVAQVGDTRALICDNTGNVLPLTTVHHADTPLESDRLARYSAGFNTTSDGIQRFLQYVNTRAFGDYQGKSRGISAEPELTEYQIGPTRGRLPGKEAFVVIMSDGVTDRASDQEVCDAVIQRAVKGGSMRGTPQDAASEILSYVGMLGTYDNATALVIRLGGWGDWSNWTDRTGKLREERLKDTLRRQ